MHLNNAKILVLILLFLTTFWNRHTADAQTDSLTVDNILTLSLEELRNIKVITASKWPESIAESPSYTLVLTEDDFKALNFNTLEEVFDYIVGSQSLRAEGNMFTTTTFRGNTLTHYNVNSLLLFDGIPLYNMYNGSFDLNTIPLSSIQQIEVLKGSNSVLYGTNAMNATINIIPKNSKNNQTSSASKLRFGNNSTLVSQNAIYGNKEELNFGLFADFQMSEGEELAYQLKSGSSDFTLRNEQKIGSIVGYVEWNDFKLNLHSSNRNLQHIDNNEIDTLYYYNNTDEYAVIYPNQADEYQNLISLSYKSKVSEKVSLNLRSCFQHYNLYQKVNYKNQHYHSHGSFNEAEILLDLHKKAQLILGIHYNNYNGYRSVETIINGTKDFQYNVSPDKTPTNDLAFYFNGNYRINKFNIFYGGRYYLSEYDGNTSSNFAPRLALNYIATSNLSFKLIYGESFRVPGYFEKGSLSLTAYGNPHLSPELSNSLDFVVTSKTNNLELIANAFVQKFSNKITRIVPTDEDLQEIGKDVSLIYKNSSQALFHGGELSAKYYISNKFSAFGGYSFVMGFNEDEDPTVLGDDLWLFHHLINGGMRYKPHDLIEISLSGKAISEWGPAPGNVVANAGLKVFPKKEAPFSIELMVNNIFNQKVYMPEVANRDIHAVPYTMKTQSRWIFLSLGYGF